MIRMKEALAAVSTTTCKCSCEHNGCLLVCHGAPSLEQLEGLLAHVARSGNISILRCVQPDAMRAQVSDVGVHFAVVLWVGGDAEKRPRIQGAIREEDMRDAAWSLAAVIVVRALDVRTDVVPAEAEDVGTN